MPKRETYIIFSFLLLFGLIPNNKAFTQDFNINVVRTNVSCNGQNDGIASCIPSGGITPYTFKWSNGGDTPTISNLGPGIYTVTVSEGSGLTAENGTFVEEPETLSATITPDHGLCNENGSAQVSTTGGSSPYSYEWSDGETNPYIENKSSGLYALTITDIKGCSIIETTQIEVDTNNIEFETIITSPSCYGYSDGSIEIVMTKGTPPYTYRWNNQESPKDIFNIGKGSYTLFIRDALECNAGITVTMSEPDELRLDFINTDTGIIGQVKGGAPPYSFKWSTGYSDDGYLKDIEVGIYGLTVTDSNGCQIKGEGEYVGPLSLNEASTIATFLTYPNPCKDELNIKLNTIAVEKKITVKLLNTLGKEVAKKTYKQTNQVNDLFLFSELNPGLFIITIEINGQLQEVHKILKAE